MVFGDGAPGRYLGLEETIRVGTSALLRGDLREHVLSFPLPLRAHNERPVVQKPGREIAPETDHVGTLTSDPWAPELRENTFLLCKPPSLWSFVTAELTVPL